MRRGVPLGLTAAAATVAVVVAGVLALGGSDEPKKTGRTEEPFTTTALAAHDTLSVPVSREPFCEAVDQRQVEAALDGEVGSSTSWQDGDTIEVADGVEDVAHEFGCQYAGADGTMARAWVFAPPVDAAQADRLSRNAGQGPGCEIADGPAFGVRLLRSCAPRPASRGRRTVACSGTPGWCARWSARPERRGMSRTAPDAGAWACSRPRGADRDQADGPNGLWLIPNCPQRMCRVRPPLTRALSLTAFALVLTALPAGLSAATGASPVSATVATEPSLPTQRTVRRPSTCSVTASTRPRP